MPNDLRTTLGRIRLPTWLGDLKRTAGAVFGTISVLLGFFDFSLVNKASDPVTTKFIGAIFNFSISTSIVFLLALFLEGRRDASKDSPSTALVPDALVPSHVETAIRTARKIRIFASNGETFKNTLMRCSDISAGRQTSLEIQILLRCPKEDNERKLALEDQIQKWRDDVESPNSMHTFKVNCSFALYEGPVMLRGILFDDSMALLSWYLRPGKPFYRSPATLPYTLYTDDSSEGKSLISSAREIFDYYFEKGKLH